MPWKKQFDKRAALDKAQHAFWSHGYEATSMQELVDCTGVNRGSLYATYGDKRELFLATLHLYDERRIEMLAELEAHKTTQEAIRGMYLAFTNEVTEGGANLGCFMTNTALELAAHDEEIRELVANAQKDMEAFFTRMIRKGKASGEIPSHIKVAETARGLLASLLGLFVLIRSRPEKKLLRAVVDDAMRRLE
ncbi:MAG: TetR/AcrR family transcriptional regulator [Hyphomicrobiaceae bacterium]